MKESEGMCMRYMYVLIVLGLMYSTVVANNKIDSFANKPDSAISGNAIKTAEEAVDRALEYTGFDKSKSYSREPAVQIARLIKAIDTTTPFLSDYINGRPVWVIEFENIYFDYDGISPKVKNRRFKDFKINIDAETGFLFKIIGSIKNDTIFPEPAASIAEQQMLNNDKYHGIASDIPELSFYDLLVEEERLLSRAVVAKNIYAVYVVYSDSYFELREPRNIWNITFKGLSPHVPSYGVKAPIDQLRTYRIRVDPITGKSIKGSLGPFHPNPPWKKN